MEKFFAIVLSVILSILGINSAPYDLQPLPENEVTLTQEQIDLFETVVEGETAWLASLQLENGAIPMTYTANGTVKMNDIDRVVGYMTNYTELMKTHAYPLYNADAAKVSLAANIMLEKVA